MQTDKAIPKDIDEYIAGFTEDIQEILAKVRSTIRATAPEAQETIKYGMPTFTLQGNLVSFAAYKRHIGLYPIPAGSEAFNRQIAAYKAEKSSARFALDQPIPYELISELVRYRINENMERAARKRAGNS
jgi:uncharacterized protein YdhG (YjbR/CyaY superfamily)